MGWFNHQLDKNVSQNVIPYSSDVSSIYPGITRLLSPEFVSFFRGGVTYPGDSLSFVEVSPPYTVWTRLEGTPEV